MEFCLCHSVAVSSAFAANAEDTGGEDPPSFNEEEQSEGLRGVRWYECNVTLTETTTGNRRKGRNAANPVFS